MKESEIEDVVKFETYKKLYKYLGGWKILVPFVIAVSLFNVIEYQKSLAVNKWAHLQASEQLSSYNDYVWFILSFCAGSSFFLALEMQITAEMNLQTSKQIFNGMLDNVMNAPINLYFDVTPIGVLQQRFGKDLKMIDKRLYDRAL